MKIKVTAKFDKAKQVVFDLIIEPLPTGGVAVLKPQANEHGVRTWGPTAGRKFIDPKSAVVFLQQHGWTVEIIEEMTPKITITSITKNGKSL